MVSGNLTFFEEMRQTIRSSTAPRRQLGLSLVELLVVLAVIGLLAVPFGSHLFKYLPKYYLQGAVQTLTMDLRSAQTQSLKTLRPWRVVINSGTHVYQIVDSVDGVLGNGDDAVKKTVDLKNSRGEIRFVSGSSVSFDESGMCAGTVTIILKNQAGSTLKVEVFRTGAQRVT